MRRNHFGSLRRHRLGDVFRMQDDIIANLRVKLADPPKPKETGDQFLWFATHKGVGHGSRAGTVETERPVIAVPRDVEESL
jgi:hypothetical protein